MFMNLVYTWVKDRNLTPQEEANKVKLFFR